MPYLECPECGRTMQLQHANRRANGTCSSSWKLTAEQKREILWLYRKGEYVRHIAKRMGVSNQSISSLALRYGLRRKALRSDAGKKR